jgi:hypothetical protein
VIGVLIIECFQSDFDTEVIRRQFNLLYRQSELALSNTIEHNRLPVVPGMRMLLSRQRRGLWSKTVWIVLLLISLTLTLFLVPADFTIEGRGELQPLARRDVFAIRDGIVPNLDPEVWSTSRSVFQGDELLKLNNSDLDYKITLVEGEKLTAQERLSTVQADRLGKNPITAEEQERDNRLAAEERELIERLSNLEKQNAILIKQFAELTLKSPISGSVVTTEIVRKLEMRPVRRGELLMSVADLQGAWVLEIKVPDHRIGHIRDARRELKSDLDVAFVLATDPSKTHHGTVDSVALSTELHDSDGPTVLVTVTFDRNQISELRPGASVIPRIHCGRRSLGYVWLHELFESIEKKLWAW